MKRTNKRINLMNDEQYELSTDLDRRAEKQVGKAVKSRPCLSSNVFRWSEFVRFPLPLVSERGGHGLAFATRKMMIEFATFINTVVKNNQPLAPRCKRGAVRFFERDGRSLDLFCLLFCVKAKRVSGV